MSITYRGIDHVQLAAPKGCEAVARAFYTGVMGLPELPKPPSMAARGGCWFACGAQQIHIGVEADFRPAKKAHPALIVADRASYEALSARVAASGAAFKRDAEMEGAGVSRFFTEDPWGNRIEVVLHEREASPP